MNILKQEKEDMLNKVLNDKLSKKIQILKGRLTKIVIKAASERYPKPIRDWMNKAPKGADFDLRGTFELRLYDTADNFHNDLLGTPSIKRKGMSWGSRAYTTVSVPSVKVLAKDSHESTLPISKALSDRVLVIEEADDLQVKKAELTAVVKAALAGVRTRKQLADKYPDLIKYLPEISPASKGLAVTNDEVVRVLSS